MDNVTLEGFDEFFNLMDKLGVNVRQTAKNGMERAVKRIAQEAQRNVPVDTGETRQSIKHSVTEIGDEIIGTVEVTAMQGFFIEYGTGPRASSIASGYGPMDPSANVSHRQTGWVYFNKRRGQFFHTTGMPARPFLYPAFMNNRDAVIADIEDEFRKAIEGATNNGGE